jgi:flagellar hook-length control protein FliK
VAGTAGTADASDPPSRPAHNDTAAGTSANGTAATAGGNANGGKTFSRGIPVTLTTSQPGGAGGKTGGRSASTAGSQGASSQAQGASNKTANTAGAANATAGTDPTSGNGATTPPGSSTPATTIAAVGSNQQTPPPTSNADIAIAVNVAASGGPKPPSPGTSGKPASSAGKGDTDDDGEDAAATGTAAPTSPQEPQAAVNPSAPIVAAPIVTAADNIAPTPAPTTTAGGGTQPISGESGHDHAKVTLALAADQGAASTTDSPDAPSANTTGAAPETVAAGGKVPADAANDGTRNNRTNTDNTAPPAQTASPDDASSTTTPGGTAADGGRAGARTGDAAATSTSGAANPATTPSGATANARPGVDGLPNFGFSLSATNASAGTDPTSAASASSSPVPIAGLAVAIAARAQSGSSQFDIRLDPPELGRIDVRLAMDGSGQVTTHMTAERPDTLALLQSQQPQIERALEQAGLKTADNGLQFTLRDQSSGGQNSGASPQQTNTAQVVVPDPDLAPVAATQAYRRAGLGSGIDIRV